MLSWFQAMLPKEERFFDMFEAHAETLTAGARALRQVLDGGDQVPAHCAAVAKFEDDADQVAREVLLAVRRTFITPFDRSDIRDLIVETADLTAQAVPLLRSLRANAKALNHITEHIVRLEGRSDALYDQGMAALYKGPARKDPMAFIVGSEIYDHLEKVVDRFEDVANRISGVLIEHL